MWGLFVFAVLGIGVFISSCKDDAEDKKWREESKKDGLDTYVDNKGRHRLVSNNHPVIRTTRRVEGNWDDVYLDMKTENILHNYSDDKRQQRQDEINKINQKNNESKREAILEGRYFYMCEEPSERCGFFEDTFYGWPEDPTFLRYAFHCRRVGDDLLLDKDTRSYEPIRDAKCRLIVYDKKAEEQGKKEVLYKHAESNWYTIKNWETNNINKTLWRDKTYFPTSTEVETYARKIDAYLDTGIKEE